MRLLGAEVVAVEAGARTLKEAVSAAIRDWVANVETTHYVIGSVVGPAPYPALVRDLQRVIGDEARAQALEAEGALPARVIACVGGGSNAIGIFTPFVDDDAVELIGVEAAGEGLESGHHGASLGAGRTGVLHGSLSSVLADEEGQILEAHSVSAGLDYPGRRPRARPPARHRPRELRRRHRRGGARAPSASSPGSRGSSRRSSPPTRSPGCSQNGGGDGYDCSASPAAATRTWPRYCSAWTADHVAAAPRLNIRRRRPRSRAAFAAAEAEGRAALMPYMMGGFPDQETSLRRSPHAYADAGADLIELGVPFSDPLADGPTIHAAATAALAAGATLEDGARDLPAVGRPDPGRPDGLREHDPGGTARPEFAAARSRRRGRRDRPRPAARRGRAARRILRRSRAGADSAGRPDDARPTAGRRSARRPRASSTSSRRRHDRRARRSAGGPRRAGRRHPGRRPTCRSRSASGSRPRAGGGGGQVADGVIIGHGSSARSPTPDAGGRRRGHRVPRETRDASPMVSPPGSCRIAPMVMPVTLFLAAAAAVFSWSQGHGRPGRRPRLLRHHRHRLHDQRDASRRSRRSAAPPVPLQVLTRCGSAFSPAAATAPG